MNYKTTLVNMAIQDGKNYVFKLLMCGTLFCQLTTTGIERFLKFHGFFFFIYGSVVLN